MVILILVNIIFIIYLYKKYYNLPKDATYTKEEIEEINPMFLSFMYDEKIGNNFDIILSEIIELNIKGYIEINYLNSNVEKYNYVIRRIIDLNSDDLKKHEMIVLNFLFAENDEITKRELESKFKNVFNIYNVQFIELKQIIDDYSLKHQLIDKSKEIEIKKKTKNYIKISALFILIILILTVVEFLDTSRLYFIMYLIEKMVSIMLLSKISYLTPKGIQLQNSIYKYRKEIENIEFLDNRSDMNDIVKNKKFANSIALHIDTNAKRAFVDDATIKNAKQVSKQIFIDIIMISTIILLLGLIVAQILTMFGAGWAFWLLFIFVLISAIIIEISHYTKK